MYIENRLQGCNAQRIMPLLISGSGYLVQAKLSDRSLALHGANPADLPIAGSTQFTMSANRAALKNLGLSLPSDLAAQVNEWID